MKIKKLLGSLFLTLVIILTMLPIDSMTVYANNGYAITLDANCNDEVTGQTYLNITSYTLPAFTRPGFEFRGWAVRPTGSVIYNAGDTVTLTDNLTLYAKWKKEGLEYTYYMVSITDGGSVNCEYTNEEGTIIGTSGTGIRVPAGASVSITAYDVAIGKRFKEWMGADGLTFTTGSATSATATFIMPANAVTLTATYEDMDTVATPTFSPAGGTYDSTQSVTISCATDGATIHYTTDGNDPTASSSVYSGAITVSETTTIRAIAVKDGMTDSSVASATYTISTAPTTYAVTVNNGTGSGNYAAGASVTITAVAPTGGKRFKEWTGADGLTFTSGTETSSTATFTMPANEVTLTATYEDMETVATPTFNPAGGAYTAAQSVTISCATNGAAIHYTTDGSEPTASSPTYSSAISVSATTTIKAIAVKSGMTNSAVSTAAYTIKSSGNNDPGNDDSENNNNSSENSNNSNDNNTGSPDNTINIIPSVIPVIPINNTEQTAIPVDNTIIKNPLPTKPILILSDIGKPFIEGHPEQDGWDVIKKDIQETIQTKQADSSADGTIAVNMNGYSVVPGDVLTEIKGQDVTVVFDLGDGIKWTINGMDVTGDDIGDIDFGVKIGTSTIPVDVINNIIGERYGIQITLAHEGDFGFTATLSVDMDAKNAGLYANLFYYNTDTGELEFICAGEIDADGIADLTFTHASDYTIVVDSEPMNGDLIKSEVLANSAEAGTVIQVTGTQGSQGRAADGGIYETSDGKAAGSLWWIMVLCVAIIAIGVVGFYVVRKGKVFKKN